MTRKKDEWRATRRKARQSDVDSDGVTAVDVAFPEEEGEDAEYEQDYQRSFSFFLLTLPFSVPIKFLTLLISYDIYI